MTLIIRPASVADASKIILGIESVCAEQIYFTTERFLSDNQWEAVLYRPETVPDHLLIIAEADGQFAGCGNLFPGMTGSKDQHVARLGLFVLKPYRERGIGTKLMEQVLVWAKKSRFRKISLSVLADNDRARHLYENFDFRIEGVLRGQYLIADKYVDAVLMALLLKTE